MSENSCHFCSETEHLESHHIVPQRFDGSDSEENLVNVCPTCHRKLESLYNKRFYDALGVSKDTEDEPEVEVTGECQHDGCYADAKEKLDNPRDGAEFKFCLAHFTCDESYCENQPAKVVTGEGYLAGLCSDHLECGKNGCHSKDIEILESAYTNDLSRCCSRHAEDVREKRGSALAVGTFDGRDG